MLRLLAQTALKAVPVQPVPLPCLCRREFLRAKNHMSLLLF